MNSRRTDFGSTGKNPHESTDTRPGKNVSGPQGVATGHAADTLPHHGTPNRGPGRLLLAPWVPCALQIMAVINFDDWYEPCVFAGGFRESES